MRVYIIVLLSLNLCCWASRLPYNDRLGSYYCPPIHEPTCASNGLNYVYFENQCSLDIRNYQEKKLGREEYIKCPLSDCYPNCKPCLSIDDPVCVIDGRTQQLLEFKNPCEVEFASCSFKKYYRFLHQGRCPYQSECSTTICSQDYRPICVNANSLYREFSNDCELQKSLCANNMKWQSAQAGPCFERRPQDDGHRKGLLGPVCASFKNESRTFQSYYQLQTEIESTGNSWSALHSGFCRQQSPCRGEIIKPICAKLNTTTINNFLSLCHLQEEKKKTGQNWAILYQGLCRPSSTSVSSSRDVVEATTEKGATTEWAVENIKEESTSSTDKGLENRNGSENTNNPVQEETTEPTEITKCLGDEGTEEKIETTENSLNNQSSGTISISNKDNVLEFGILSDAANPDDRQNLIKTTSNTETTPSNSYRREDIATIAEEVNNEIPTDESSAKGSANGNQSSVDNSFDLVTPKQETANEDSNSFSIGNPNPEISIRIGRNLEQSTINENSNSSRSMESNGLPNRLESNSANDIRSDKSGNSVIPAENDSDGNESPSSFSNFSDESSDKNFETNETPSQGNVKGNKVTHNQESINESSGNSVNNDVPKQGTNNESANPSGNIRKDGNKTPQTINDAQFSSPDVVDATFGKANETDEVTENQNRISTHNSDKSESSDQVTETVAPTVNVDVDKMLITSDQRQNPVANLRSGLDSFETIPGDPKETKDQFIRSLRMLLDMYVIKDRPNAGSASSVLDGSNISNEIPDQEANKAVTTYPVLTVGTGSSSENDLPNQSTTSGIFENNEGTHVESNNTGNRTPNVGNNIGNSNSDNLGERNEGIHFPIVIDDSLNSSNGVNLSDEFDDIFLEAAPSPLSQLNTFLKKLAMLKYLFKRDNSPDPEIGNDSNKISRQAVYNATTSSPDSTANIKTASNGEVNAGYDEFSNSKNLGLDAIYEFENNTTLDQGANNAAINPVNQGVETESSNASAATETQNQGSTIKQFNTLGNSGFNETSVRENGSPDAITNESYETNGLPIQVSQIADTPTSIPGNITLSQEPKRSSLNSAEISDSTNFPNLESIIRNLNSWNNIGITGVTSDFLNLDGVTESSVRKQNEKTKNLNNSKLSPDFRFVSDAVTPDQMGLNASGTHGNNTYSSPGVSNIRQNITKLKSNETFSNSTRNTPPSSNTHRVTYNGAVYTAPASYSPTFNFITLPNGENHKFPFNPHEFLPISPSDFPAYFGHSHTKPQIRPPVIKHQINKPSVKIAEPFKPPSHKIGRPFQQPKPKLEIEQPFKPHSHEIGIPSQQHPKPSVEIGQPFMYPSHDIGHLYYSPSEYPLINNAHYDTHLPVATADEDHQLPEELFPDSIFNTSPVDHPSISHSSLTAPVPFPRSDINYGLGNLDLEDLKLLWLARDQN